MKNDNVTESEQNVESWVLEAQLSADDLDAVIGGLVVDSVTCGGTYCESTYKKE